MPHYKYRGVHRHSGARAKGTMEAGTKIDVVRSLAAQGITVTAVEESRHLLSWEYGGRGTTARWRIDFFRRLAAFVEARLSVPDALALMAKDGQGTTGQREIVARLAAAVAGGSSLTTAIREAGAFPANAVALVEAGEASGNLERLLPGAADMLENSYRARQRLITMLIYPALMLTALMAAMALLILFVLPAFSHLFAQLGAQLPPITRLVLFTGNMLTDVGWIILAGVSLSAVALLLALRNPRYRCQLDRLLLRLPLLGGLLTLSDSADTAAALSALTGGGLPLADSLEIAAGVPANTYLSWQLRRAASAARAGRRLVAALGSDSGFSPIFLSLTAVGEETGTLPDSLERAAEICRYESRSRRKKLEAMVEPAILLLIGGLVAILVFALALPLLDTVTVL
ncbi:MAG: type II secretion system F family protein [Selenomonadaceae bacterium]|nr:type II secretion system F family protein [Selenomonadaceae bacterium]